MDLKIFLGLLAILVGTIGYIPYFRNIFSGKTKPHVFSWLVWGILTTIAFAGQVAGKGGAGTWVTGFTALACFTIVALSLVKGSRDFPLVDWICLLGCAVSLGFWAITDNPLTAIVLVTIIDLVGFLPTFRKSYTKPNSETAFTYLMGSAKFFISLLALHEYSATTVLYPASLVITNGLFVIMIVIRRRQLKAKSA